MSFNRLWPADIAPAAIAQGLRPLGEARPLFTLRGVVRSTNEVVPPQMLLVADAQRGGKGRRGRRWASPAGGNLYWSARFPKAEWEGAPAWLSLAMGVAVARSLAGFGVSGIHLKWPNDIQDPGGRKLGGILVEGRSRDWVVGVGINVAFAPLVDSVSLAEMGFPRIGRGCLAGALGRQVWKILDAGLREGGEPIRSAWHYWGCSTGPVAVFPKGGAMWMGEALGLDNQARLRVATHEGERRLSGEECSMRLQEGEA